MTDSLIIRDVEVGDLAQVLELLSHLTSAPALSQIELEMLHNRRVMAGVRTLVAVDPEAREIVGTASLLVEPKFTRGGKSVGHVEDVVTHPRCRGKGIGQKLLQRLVEAAKEHDCYKVILDCSDNTIAYYSKAGFRKCENQMRLDIV
ncbi:putative glucosamine 6-phosphate n-acetyltransferase [Leptomonas pyrrhocoris]|uniref:Glucosamine 6-phosphate N-acetyltransferase n=1 Tax=Leptomonas pyrrhocoris TaxID=157538 RepID=A0A0M9G8T4_LEPPY|nr:putative glucosamine 6-phosphate n-acetyltransferase [Leptomonas pyrrhocoris]KPA85057.1 putative glucosamine 6-phosphate n-acetyltransferase [Leptomonas pyrrhocoris]|eukprot:XP_015663496.1 putative glucosamine 6-phosphate n-acetyltransferase [Leptomonas pyrrhocoris]